MKTISVIGLGYIGLPTAALVASHGFKVVGVDCNESVVKNIQLGQVQIAEPGLQDYVTHAVNNNLLVARTKVTDADIFIIAVPTPVSKDFTPDLSYIDSVVLDLAKVLKKGDLVILESTSPVGTTENISKKLAQLRPDLKFPHIYKKDADIHVVFSPERIIPGRAIDELQKNPRIIGGVSKKCAKLAKDFYQKFVLSECYITDSRTAEMCKLTENAFRDVNIAFANEISMICDNNKINTHKLFQLANLHPRVNILKPGPGVGGHCIAVDPWFIIASNLKSAKLLKTARYVNTKKSNWVVKKVNIAVRKRLDADSSKTENNLKVGFLGLSYKENSEDLRESPSLYIIKKFAKTFTGKIIAVEPYITSLPEPLAQYMELKTVDYALQNVDIIVLLVAHDNFKIINLDFLDDKKILNFTSLKLNIPSKNSSSLHKGIRQEQCNKKVGVL